MTRKLLVHIVDAVVVLAVAYFVAMPFVQQEHAPKSADPFAEQVDIEPMRKIALHDVGRIRSFDSFARSIVRDIAGPRGIEKQDPVYTYLDLMFDREKYRDRYIFYVKKAIRPQMRRVMLELDEPMDRIERFMKTGMVSETLLRTSPMIEEFERLDADVVRTAKFANRVRYAFSLSDPHELSGRLRIVPPPGGTDRDAWLTGEQIWGAEFLSALDSHDHGDARMDVPGLAPELRESLVANWNSLATAWRQRDARTASIAIAALASGLSRVEPSLYPAAEKLELESWYFRMNAFVWDWIVYILAVIPLLLSVIYRWRAAYRIGVVILVVAFAIHTGSLGIRWYLAGRIPNANMFEAILAATWFGVLGAFVLEFWVRKTSMRGLFHLGAAVCSMVAMMCQHFMPVTLRSDIENVMPVLDSVWLYIHTNVIIWSYALIGMASVTGLLYLRYRLGGGNAAVAKAGGAGSLILDGTGKGDSFMRENPSAVGQVLDAATLVTLELSFIMLWAGVVMGAIWADQSWGRPWGWDPKEVFALCTFVLFIILVHVRFKVRDKGLWTAILAVVGCGVMLFNWLVINFKIQGLHSYA